MRAPPYSVRMWCPLADASMYYSLNDKLLLLFETDHIKVIFFFKCKDTITFPLLSHHIAF